MTVQELYRAVQLQSSTRLLSNYTPDASLNDFWRSYRENHEDLDRAFARAFANFKYYNPLGDEGITDWLIDVRSILHKNEKRYSEMWRIQVIEDSDLPLTYNYDMKEEYTGTSNNQSAMTSGQRTDVNNTQIGSQKSANVNKATAFNTANENVTTSDSSATGNRNDITQFTKGQETDTSRGQSADQHTLTRKGNIGVQTGSEILQKFSDSMPVFDFYNKIFAEICEELLQIGG